MAGFAFTEKNGIRWGCFPAWEALGVCHGFTCRVGGESDLVPGGLNMALHVGDDPEKVLENRRKAAAAMGFDLARTATCAQVHGTVLAKVTEAEAGRGALELATTIPGTDGLLTDCTDLPLMLFYADCTPVLLVDTESTAIAVLHAGWRGSVGRIAQKGVQALHDWYGTRPEAIVAGIGPSIGPCCYEVDDKVRDRAKGFEGCFAPHGEGHYLLDLWKLNQQQLVEAGVKPENISVAEVCTCCHNDQYFSYRREKGKTGRLAAVLWRKS